ncbi:hypothetical protein VB796_06660 [Arcicella sp. LKC2W]|uniref:hypothetical protein n=1 Tax=Arcicella sp. LKC2W TaxID=2984198 RepID=UPI002B21B0CA|nr:hypothetical protein [Arcicella sp. LKC2W]MEA5458709.1 hypothetical protein [Arcicella sp. LKC2W]
MIYQGNIKPLIITSTATIPTIASVLVDDIEVGKLTGFPINGKITYYLESLLLSLKLQEQTPDFETKVRAVNFNKEVKIIVDNQIITDTLLGGVDIPHTQRLTNNPKRAALDHPYQVVYYLNKPIFGKLYASVNGGAYTEIDHVKSVANRHLIINYHKYYEELNLQEYDKVIFHFGDFREVINLNAYYTDTPFILTMRNKYGFWDCFKFYGNQENHFDFAQTVIENMTESVPVYNEITEKVIIESGLLEGNERYIIAENLSFLDTYEYRNGQFFRLINTQKSIVARKLKDTQDTHKLEFQYANIKRVTR